MGTGMSLPKETFTIGKTNRNSHNLFRLYNVQDHLYPFEEGPKKKQLTDIKLSLALEMFNSMVTQRLNKSPHKNMLSDIELDTYKNAVNPSKILNKMLISNYDAKDLRIEVSSEDKQIYLCRNYIVEINEMIGKIKSITILQLCCNYLKVLPYGIGQLRGLKMLIVSRNRLLELPEDIGECKELREIDLSFNFIKTLPKSLSGLKKLNTLQLGNNLIEEVPYFLGKITALKYLNLSNNPIKSIPLEILKLPFLLSLNCTGCNLNITKKRFEIAGEMTLMETAARNMIRKNIPITKRHNKSIREYLFDVKECCFCGGPFFNHFVEVEDIDIFDSEEYPVYYRMCCAHYNKHEDRLTTLFEFSLPTFPSKIAEENLPSVCEIFEPICFDDRQRRMMEDGFDGYGSKMPLISLAKYNTGNYKRKYLNGIFDDHLLVSTHFDDLSKS